MPPFVSIKQRNFLFLNKPKVAAEFARETPKDAKLPVRAEKKKSEKRKKKRIRPINL